MPPTKPNKDTEAALRETQEGDLKSFNTIEELLKDLNEDDEDAEG